ncbi:MAG: hypothetical protein ACPGVE_08185 [Flavobacteriales bacterium]
MGTGTPLNLTRDIGTQMSQNSNMLDAGENNEEEGAQTQPNLLHNLNLSWE